MFAVRRQTVSGAAGAPGKTVPNQGHPEPAQGHPPRVGQDAAGRGQILAFDHGRARGHQAGEGADGQLRGVGEQGAGSVQHPLQQGVELL